ncbi:MAG TPA: mannose-6-phosphate isomerase, class I [Actinomycetes bacterium]
MTALPLDTAVRHYSWGSHTVLPALLGRPEPSDRPWAEIWIGAHPDDPSRLPDGRTLADVVPDLPFLVKLLAAEQPLSIQAHPDRAQATEGFAREEAAGLRRDDPRRNYRDRNHKPELLVALGHTEALCGFRPPAEALRLVRLVGSPLLERLTVPLAHPDEEHALRETVAAVLGLDGVERDRLVSEVAAACGGHRAEAGSSDAAALDWVVRLAVSYPGDAGIVAPLLMRLVRLEPGQAVFLESGVLHAYLRGVGVEVQASSDNVLRGGLTAKHVDLDELRRVVRYAARTEPRVWPRPVSDGVEAYDVPVSDFAVWRVEVAGTARPVPAVGPAIVVCVAGQVAVGGVALDPGRAAFLPAGSGPLVVTGTGTCFVTAPGSH